MTYPIWFRLALSYLMSTYVKYRISVVFHVWQQIRCGHFQIHYRISCQLLFINTYDFDLHYRILCRHTWNTGYLSCFMSIDMPDSRLDTVSLTYIIVYLFNCFETDVPFRSCVRVKYLSLSLYVWNISVCVYVWNICLSVCIFEISLSRLMCVWDVTWLCVSHEMSLMCVCDMILSCLIWMWGGTWHTTHVYVWNISLYVYVKCLSHASCVCGTWHHCVYHVRCCSCADVTWLSRASCMCGVWCDMCAHDIGV